jgi:putative flippase GtrA
MRWTLQFRFLAVGALNAAVGYGLFCLFIWLRLPYPLAIALATLLGVAFNFQSTGRLVFGGAPASRFARFIAVYGVVYLLNVAAVAGLLWAGLNVYAANAVAILPLAAIAFMLQRTFVFAAP